MTSSTIAAVKSALVSTLSSALPSAQVIYGPRGAVTVTKPQIVVVGDVRGLHEVIGLSPLGNDVAERYEVDIVVSVTLPGANTQQQATETALSLWESARAVIDSLNDSVTGIPAVIGIRAIGEDWELTESADGNGRNAAVVFKCQVEADIS